MKRETEGEEKRMEAKAYLEQARNINIQIDSKLEQVSALRQLAIKASSTLSPVRNQRFVFGVPVRSTTPIRFI